MNTARVLDVGNCDPDHSAIRHVLESNFAVSVDRVMYVEEALRAIERASYQLVLVNRRIFADDSDGTELIRALRRDPRYQQLAVMLVSNFEEAQARAVADGAAPGFGKAALQAAQTLSRLAQHLPARGAALRRSDKVGT